MDPSRAAYVLRTVPNILINVACRDVRDDARWPGAHLDDSTCSLSVHTDEVVRVFVCVFVFFIGTFRNLLVLMCCCIVYLYMSAARSPVGGAYGKRVLPSFGDHCGFDGLALGTKSAL